MDRYVTLEDLRGLGTVYREGQAIQRGVRYTVRVTRREIDSTTANDLAELKTLIAGWLTLRPGVGSSLIGIPIELECEGGRRWCCQVTSGDGHVTDCGGFVNAPG